MFSDDLKAPLTEKQVYEITQTLSVKQKEFLETFTKRSRKSKWLEVLANKKGIVIEENMTEEEISEAVQDWVLLEVLDAGYGNTGFYHCECGAGLRFQYIVYHQPENKTYKLGETCLENYTRLSNEILKDIKKGFHKINLQRDELLIKIVHDEYFVEFDDYSEIEIPKELRHQIKCDMPLLDKQINQLDELLRDFHFKERHKKEEERQRKMHELRHKRARERYLKQRLEKEEENICMSDEDVTVPDFESMTDGSLESVINRSKQQSQHVRKAYHKKVDEVLERVYAPEKSAYKILYENHIEELRLIRKVENNIPLGLIRDWETIQSIFRDAKAKKEFDYGRFKMLLNNLKIPLGIV